MKPNIVILDAEVANGGDISWHEFEEIGSVTIYPRTAPDEVVERAINADILIVNKIKMSADVINALPKLKYIGEIATGYDNIDLQAADAHGITVTNVPGYATDSVAQSVFAMLLDITNNVAGYNASVKRGDWLKCRDFSYRITPIDHLTGKTMAIYGLGNIGLKVAAIANAFGMHVISPTHRCASQLPEYVERVSVDEMFRRADVLSLNAPSTPDNYHIVNAMSLAIMKSDAIIINTARGNLIDSYALADALNTGHLGGAAVDVLETEPPRPNDPLVACDRCIVTPHIAWQSTLSRRSLLAGAAANIRAWLDGNPTNVLTPLT